MTPLYLPPYSPELNSIERLWAYLKSHYLSNRPYDDYDALLNAGVHAWNSLSPDQVASICSTSWLTPEDQS